MKSTGSGGVRPAKPGEVYKIRITDGAGELFLPGAEPDSPVAIPPGATVTVRGIPREVRQGLLLGDTAFFRVPARRDMTALEALELNLELDDDGRRVPLSVLASPEVEVLLGRRSTIAPFPRAYVSTLGS